MLAPLRARMETAFAADLSAVRIHARADDAVLARSLGAQAFTLGRDIFVDTAQVSANADGGSHVLSHEIAHVLQDEPGRVRRYISFANHPTVPPGTQITTVDQLQRLTGVTIDPRDKAAGAVIAGYLASTGP